MIGSNYNVLVSTGKGDYLLYNMLTGATLNVDDEFKSMVDTNNFESLDQQYINPLSDMGILIGDKNSEKQLLLYKQEKLRFGASHSDFIIFPTMNCNLECKYCYESDYEDKGATLDEVRIKMLLKFIQSQTIINNSKWCVLSLFGGEPLFAKDQTIKIVSEMKKWSEKNNKILYISMATNGILIDEELRDNLFNNIDTVQITLDGPKNIHDTLRIYKNGKGSYEEIINSLKIIKDSKTHITLRIHVDIQDGIEKLLENVKITLQELEERGVKEFSNLHLYYSQRAPPNACDQFIEKEFFLPAEKFGIEIFPQIWNLTNKLGWAKKLDIDSSKVTQNILYCGYSKYSTYIISPNLDLHMCPVFTGYDEYKIGNIADNGRPVWNSNYYDLMSRNSLEMGCSECKYLVLCGGGCPIRAYQETGNFKNSSCWTKKNLSEQRITAYLKYKYPEKFSKK